MQVLAAGHLLTVATGIGASMQLAQARETQQARHQSQTKFNVDTDFTELARNRKQNEFFLLLSGSNLISTLCFLSLFTVALPRGFN